MKKSDKELKNKYASNSFDVCNDISVTCNPIVFIYATTASITKTTQFELQS